MYSATDPNTVFRNGHQRVTLKPYTATLHPLLQFVNSRSTSSTFSVDLEQGADLGAIASSLSPTIGSLEGALERMFSSTSLKYSRPGRPLFEQVHIAFTANSGLCFSFLQHCTNYGENVLVWCRISVALFIPRVGAPSDLRERTMGLRSEVTDISMENAASTQGLSSYRSTHMSLITDRSGYFYLPFRRAMDVQNCLQQGPEFRTEDHFWVDPRIDYPAR